MKFLSIKHIYVKFVLIVLGIYVLDNFVLLQFGVKTEGIVQRNVIRTSGGAGYPNIRYPVIQYGINDKKYTFNGPLDYKVNTGDKLTVIYRPWRPKKAKIYTFWGVGKRPMIQIIIVLILWSIIYSSFKPTTKHKR